MNALQIRAKEFLARPIPEGMPYVADSTSERFIASYAEAGTVELDDELAELLEICVMEANTAAENSNGEEADFFRESYEILKAIRDESRR